MVADKAISVSNVANGTTRLQPVVLLTGQAAGALAALAARQGREPRAVPVRDVQRALLEAGALLLPYLDVPPSHPLFARVQRVGATGILKGRGVPHQWANQTWFYPDFPIDAATLQAGLLEFEKVEIAPADGRPLTVGEATAMVERVPGGAPARRTRPASGHGSGSRPPPRPSSGPRSASARTTRRASSPGARSPRWSTPCSSRST